MALTNSDFKVDRNPIAQTFRVEAKDIPGSDGCYLTAVDLFFKSAAPKAGVTVWIANCENGKPVTSQLIEGSETHLIADQIHISDNATIPTRVIFPGAVYVKAGRQYAICVYPDGGNPDIKIFVAQQGEDDVLTGAKNPNNWNGGTFFASAGGAWEPKLDTDLKFAVYRATFGAGYTGNVTLTNADLEFFTLTTQTGTFTKGEELWQVPSSYVNGHATAVSGNTTLAGTSTKFSTWFSAGDTIALYANSTVSDVVKIKSITSNTSMELYQGPSFGATANLALTPCGVVEKYEAKDGVVKIIVKDSTAKSGTLFTQSSNIKGVDSNANAVISTIDSHPISYLKPFLGKTTPSATRVSSTFTSTNAADITDTVTKPLMFGSDNRISDHEGAIFSKSKEIADNSGNKSFVVSTTMKTTNKFVSPIVDGDISTLETYHHKINNDSSNERTFGQGSANTKYVSKTVTLATGLEAEDLNVYLTAYRPANTTLECYARIINASDTDTLIDRQWTKLVEEDAQKNMFSDNNQLNDMREFKFSIPQIPTIDSTNKQAYTANTTSGSTEITTNGSGFSAGDLVVVSDGTWDTYATGRVVTANTTKIVCGSGVDVTISNGDLYKVKTDEKRSAFKQTVGSSFRLRYFDSSGREFENFNMFQIKVVMLAEQARRVPRIADVRAIALSA